MIYVSSACIKNNYICETIKQYADAGVKNIELSGGTKYYDNIEKDLFELKRKYDLKYVCHAYFPPHKEDIVINLASCNDDIYRKSIKHYEKCINMLNRLEIKTLSVHAGFLIEINVNEIGNMIKNYIIYPKKKAYDRFVSAFQYINDLCEKEEIDLYLENNVISLENFESFKENNYMMMTDSDNIKVMRGKIEFKLLLDLGHLYVSSNTLQLDYAEECKKLSNQAEWLHISDNNGIVDQHLPFDKTSRILEQYEKMKNDNLNVTLEIKGNMTELLKNIELL